MSDLQRILERNRINQKKREERRKRKGVECNMCCTDEETGTPGCIEESCKAICDKCPECPKPTDNKMAKVAPIDNGKPETQEMRRGGRKTRRKRRKKRRKSRKNRKKTKRRRKRRRKKSKKVRRK